MGQISCDKLPTPTPLSPTLRQPLLGYSSSMTPPPFIGTPHNPSDPPESKLLLCPAIWLCSRLQCSCRLAFLKLHPLMGYCASCSCSIAHHHVEMGNSSHFACNFHMVLKNSIYGVSYFGNSYVGIYVQTVNNGCPVLFWLLHNSSFLLWQEHFGRSLGSYSYPTSRVVIPRARNEESAVFCLTVRLLLWIQLL